MQDIQEIFNRIQQHKKEQKDLRSMYKDALSNTSGYQELLDEIKILRDKKKAVETSVREGLASELMRLEDLNIDIASDNELLTDIAITKMMNGETVELTDDKDQQYQPTFSVKFKKI